MQKHGEIERVTGSQDDEFAGHFGGCQWDGPGTDEKYPMIEARDTGEESVLTRLRFVRPHEVRRNWYCCDSKYQSRLPDHQPTSQATRSSNVPAKTGLEEIFCHQLHLAVIEDGRRDRPEGAR